MAENHPFTESEFLETAKRIVREYLSGLGWIRTHRDNVYREIVPAMDREKEEEKFREFSRQEEDIEWKFSQAVEFWRKSNDPKRRIILEYIVKALVHRNDLGYFGKRIINRLKKELEN